MSLSRKATVILPTTTDRGALLPYSVGSVLQQSLTEFELFIIGDGVNPQTRATIADLVKQDDRIRFFDHPKHPRRGEVYRHRALAEARGEIVAYLCDRDLWLPEHLGTLHELLQTHDLATVNHYDVSPQQRITYGAKRHGYGKIPDLSHPEVAIGAHKLSSAGHTLAAYRSLPEGWRTTPADQATDRYMWRQFLGQPGLRVYHTPHPTFLYFKRGGHPGLSTAERRVELAAWWAIMQNPHRIAQKREEALGNFLSDTAYLRTEQLRPLLVRGARPLDFLRDVPGKVRRRLRNRKRKPAQW